VKSRLEGLPLTACAAVALVALAGAAGCGASAPPPETSTLLLPAPPPDQQVAPAPSIPTRRGMGVGPYHLGQTEAELVELAGDPTATRSMEEEAELWRGSGYDPDAEGPFLVGFDHVLEFEQADTARRGDHTPLFKAFVRRGKVVGLTFTAYGVDDGEVRGLGMPPCTFHAPEASIAERFGPAEAVEPSGSGNEHLYPTQGISVITENGSVLVIHLHEPLDEDDARKVRERVRPADPQDGA
jgi:hypothetical protein